MSSLGHGTEATRLADSYVSVSADVGATCPRAFQLIGHRAEGTGAASRKRTQLQQSRASMDGLRMAAGGRHIDVTGSEWGATDTRRRPLCQTSVVILVISQGCSGAVAKGWRETGFGWRWPPGAASLPMSSSSVSA